MHTINLNFLGDEEIEFSKIIEACKLFLSQNELEGIHRIKTALQDYALADIKKIACDDHVLASFILCSCFIEQVATYRYGTDNVGPKHFKAFVTEYLPDYDGWKLRTDLRNKLVHNYSLGDTYFLTRENRTAHLKPDISSGAIILNLENFVDDLEKALHRFLIQLLVEPDVRRNALDVLSKNYIIGMSHSDYNNTTPPDPGS